MGYNRSGTRRTARLKRRKRYEKRLLEKMEAQSTAAAPEKKGLGQKVREAADKVVHKVGDVLHAAAEKIKEVVHPHHEGKSSGG